MKSVHQLTSRQDEILEFIRERQVIEGVPPTHGEIADHFGLKSINGVRQHLRLMEKKGTLRLIRGQARGIRLTLPFPSDHGHGICEIPLVGHIAAGLPIPAVEDAQETLNIGSGIFPGSHLFALRVTGDSMIDAGILDGDMAIINQQPQVETGDIAAVVLDEEATLKRVFQEPGTVRLKAENAHYPDIVITRKSNLQVRIAGKFVGLIRHNLQRKSIRSR